MSVATYSRPWHYSPSKFPLLKFSEVRPETKIVFCIHILSGLALLISGRFEGTCCLYLQALIGPRRSVLPTFQRLVNNQRHTATFRKPWVLNVTGARTLNLAWKLFLWPVEVSAVMFGGPCARAVKHKTDAAACTVADEILNSSALLCYLLDSAK
jgi:hypothetical protein